MSLCDADCMKTYSSDLRERLLAAVDRGIPRKEVAKTFGVSLATIKRWLKRRRETGDVAPKRKLGMKPCISATLEERQALWEQLEAHDDATLEEQSGSTAMGSWPTSSWSL
jgi:transposase